VVTDRTLHSGHQMCEGRAEDLQGQSAVGRLALATGVTPEIGDKPYQGVVEVFGLQDPGAFRMASSSPWGAALESIHFVSVINLEVNGLSKSIL
jgi:hypothetical protein